MKSTFYDHVIEKFSFEDFYFENIRIERPDGMFKTIKRDFDLIVFNSKKIIFFAHIDNAAETSNVVLQLRAALNGIVNKLSLSLNDFVVLAASEKKYYFLNKYNDKLTVFDKEESDCLKVLEFIENELAYGSDVFDYSSLRVLSDVLTLSASTQNFSKTKEKVKTSADGHVFVNKHGTWREASDLNTEMLYILTVFGGMFGLHLFYQKKRAKGILYLISFGLFGIGWFFDCVEILLGIYKDKEGRYLVPLENKLSGLLLLILGVVEFVVLFFIFKFLLNLFAGAIPTF